LSRDLVELVQKFVDPLVKVIADHGNSRTINTALKSETGLVFNDQTNKVGASPESRARWTFVSMLERARTDLPQHFTGSPEM
jgi:hypothetical protein